MISALLYLQYHSFRNRLITRLRRLKQPKYLAGAIVGGLYFYFYFFRYLFVGPGRRRGWGMTGIAPENLALYESLGALALFIFVFMAWLIPHARAALTFSETEVAFLFPAPISRRGLIHFKLVRSQVRIFFTVVFLTLITNRGGTAWIHAAGYWLILSTLNLHLLGSSFARSMLLDHGISNALRRAVVIGLALALVGTVLFWAESALPPFKSSDLSSARAMADYARSVLTSGPALYLLYPFRWLVRPYLAPNAQAFLAALGPALLIVFLHYIWVVYSNVAFEEASVEASQKMATRIAAAKGGTIAGSNAKRKARRPPFKLAATGAPAVGLLWKNLISAGQAFTWRVWMVIFILGLSLYAGLGTAFHSGEVFTALSIAMGAVLGWSLLLGPQFLRQDLRQDLPLADLLKTYPLRGWQIILGELLAPAAILSAAQGLLVIFATVLFLHSRGLRDGALPISLAFAALILLPVLDLLLLLIPNAAVLLFPSWIQAGREGPRGIEATGQRLILMLGQLAVFAVTLIPAAIVFLIVFLVVRFAVGLALAVPLGAIAAAVVLAIEVVLGLLLLGRWFERFDVSAELNP